jgi:hypothetical protein
MVRTLAVRSSKGQKTLILPGSTAAEPWELWSTGTSVECIESHQSLQDFSTTSLTTLALPAAQVIALPLWLPETRREEFPSMIALEIEAHGLKPRNHEAIFNWSVVAQEEKRTLVLAGVLAALLPPELENAPANNFDLSVRCWNFQTNAMTFWSEQDHLVVAITRGSHLVYYQSLSEAAFTTRVLQDINCLLSALRMQQMVEHIERIEVWTDHPVVGMEKLSEIAGTTVHQESKPAPQLPGEPWRLTPDPVGAAIQSRKTNRIRLRVGALLGLIVVAALGAFAVYLFLISRELSQLEHWQSAHAADLTMVQDTTTAWSDLQPVVDTHSYPLEVLLHVSRALPDQDVHLTLFELDGHHLLLRAEAKNLTAGFAFFDHLKKSPQLSGFTWEMAQPHLLGNDVTQLQIEGTYAHAN